MPLNGLERTLATMLTSILRNLWMGNCEDDDLSQDIICDDQLYRITLVSDKQQARFVLYRIEDSGEITELMTFSHPTDKYADAVDLISRCIELDTHPIG